MKSKREGGRGWQGFCEARSLETSSWRQRWEEEISYLQHCNRSEELRSGWQCQASLLKIWKELLTWAALGICHPFGARGTMWKFFTLVLHNQTQIGGGSPLPFPWVSRLRATVKCEQFRVPHLMICSVSFSLLGFNVDTFILHLVGIKFGFGFWPSKRHFKDKATLSCHLSLWPPFPWPNFPLSCKTAHWIALFPAPKALLPWVGWHSLACCCCSYWPGRASEMFFCSSCFLS